MCAVDTFQAVLKKYDVRYPALNSGRKKSEKYRKYCIAEYQKNKLIQEHKCHVEINEFQSKTPQKNNSISEQKLSTEMMNFWVYESDSSSAGVVQLKKRKEGGMFFMWERRGGLMSLFVYFPSLCENIL